MVDVGEKIPSKRMTHARSHVHLPPDVMKALRTFSGELQDVEDLKGAVFTTAIMAGVNGCKKTAS